MEDDDTELTPTPVSDTDGLRIVVHIAEALADTDRDVQAQAPDEILPMMLEDTGVVIVERPTSGEGFMITLRGTIDDPGTVNFAEASRIDWEDDATTDAREIPVPHALRAGTAGEWPPTPRAPAPTIGDNRTRRAKVYTIVPRPDTKN
jgi:hypothetical protein